MKKQGFIKHGEHEQDFELNLASIIDCFVVLISFMLVSTAFFSIGIIDAEVAGSSDSVAASESNSVMIELKADHSISVHSSVSKANAMRIAAKGQTWDLERLTTSLKAFKQSMPDLKSAILVADNSVSYRDVMKTMETARGEVPSVNLGGF